MNPKTFTPTRADTTFVGWSSSASSTEVLTDMVADGNPITLYAVFKYDDLPVTLTKTSISDPGYNIYAYSLNATFYSGIDTAKYSGLSVYVNANASVNHRGGYWYIYLSAGESKTRILSPSCNWGDPHSCSSSSKKRL